jgi:SAM-dependent methyltransferase
LPEGKLLEIGSGGGRDAKELIKLGYDYTGTDISKSLIKQAKKNNPGAIFLEKSVYDLGYTDDFDGFWCSAVLLHIPRPKINRALESIKKAMHNNAVGFISIKEGDGEQMESSGELKRLFTYWHNNEFNKILRDQGFDILYKDYKPVTEHTKWLIYFVRVNK